MMGTEYPNPLSLWRKWIWVLRPLPPHAADDGDGVPKSTFSLEKVDLGTPSPTTIRGVGLPEAGDCCGGPPRRRRAGPARGRVDPERGLRSHPLLCLPRRASRRAPR